MSIRCAPIAQRDLSPPLPDAARSVPAPSPAPPSAQIADSLKTYLGSEVFQAWSQDLTQRLGHVGDRIGYGLGHIEETVRQSTFALQCQLVEQAMQAKADATPALCVACLGPLIDTKQQVQKSIKVYCGYVTLKR